MSKIADQLQQRAQWHAAEAKRLSALAAQTESLREEARRLRKMADKLGVYGCTIALRPNGQAIVDAMFGDLTCLHPGPDKEALAEIGFALESAAQRRLDQIERLAKQEPLPLDEYSDLVIEEDVLRRASNVNDRIIDEIAAELERR